MAKSVNWYRIIKKRLNPYHHFSFRMPVKGRDFTPQQKSAIFRLWIAHGSSIQKAERGVWTFLPKRAGIGQDSVPRSDKTNKGIFINMPGATLKKSKNRRPVLVVRHKQIKEIYIPFPKNIGRDIDLIKQFVDKKRLELNPGYIMWAVGGNMGKIRYNPEVFDQYMTAISKPSSFYGKEIAKGMSEASESAPLFTGVYFGWRMYDVDYIDVRDGINDSIDPSDGELKWLPGKRVKRNTKYRD